MIRMHIVLALTATAAFAQGCALTSKADPVVPRYFTPVAADSAAPRPVQPPRAVGNHEGDIRLGRVNAGSHLKERIVFRDSKYEVGYYEDRLWSESPEVYLRRAMERALFEERPLTRVVSGSSPTLELELIAFEEVRARSKSARVTVKVTLHDDQLVRWQQTLTFDEPLREGGDIDEVARALGKALHHLTEQIATRVETELPRMAAHDPEPPCVPAPTASGE